MARVSAERRDIAAQRLAMGRPVDEVARTIGVDASTIRKWRRDDTEFKTLLQRYLDGMYGRGLLAVAERRAEPGVRVERGVTSMETLRQTMTEIGRREARRGR